MADKSYNQMTDAELDDALLNQMSDEELDAKLLEQDSASQPQAEPKSKVQSEFDKYATGNLPIGQKIIAGAKDLKNIGVEALSRVGEEGSYHAIHGQALPQAIKRILLNRAIPGDDIFNSSMKMAILEGTSPDNLLAGVKLANTPKSLLKPGSTDIESMIKQSAEEYNAVGKNVIQTQRAEMAQAKNSYNAAKRDIASRVDAVEKELIPQAADVATMTARKTWFDIAKDVSKRFGGEYESAIAGQKVNTEQLHSALGRVVEKAGVLDKAKAGIRLSDSEKKIFDYYQEVGKKVPSTATTQEIVMGPKGPEYRMVPSGSEILDLSDIDKDLQRIFRSRAGAQYGSGDHILTTTREEIADVFGDTSNKLKAVRMKYAPELQMKNEAYKIFQPFNRSGSYDTTKGINFFSNYAKGAAKPDELRLINALKSKAGDDFLDDLHSVSAARKDLAREQDLLGNQMSKKADSIKEQSTKALIKTSEEAKNHVEFLNSMKQQALADEDRAAVVNRLIRKGAGIAVGGGLVGAGVTGGSKLIQFLF